MIRLNAEPGEALHALAYAAGGWAIHLCRGKVPVTENGFRDATTDPAKIRAMVDAHPDATHLGIWPARCDPPMAALDVDCKNNAPGYASLAQLNGEIPPTYTVETPSGGSHIYLKLPPDTPPIGNRQLLPGIDVRSENGYVIAYADEPPDAFEVAELPAELLTRMAAAQERAPNAHEWLCEPDLSVNVAHFTRWVQAEVEAGRVAIAGQGANSLTYAVAAKARGCGISEALCFEILWKEWNAHSLPRSKTEPRHVEQLETIIRNAYEYALRPAGSEAFTVFAAKVEQVEAEARAKMPVNEKLFPVLTVDQVTAHQSLNSIIKRFLYRETLTMFVGPYSQYKSFIVLDQAAHVALGLDWAGNKVAAPQDVLYIVAEGKAGIGLRIAAWQKHRQRPKPQRLRFITVPLHLMNDAEKLRDTLDALAAEGFRPAVIYIDTLAAATEGTNENTSDMGVPIGVCRRLCIDRRAAVVLVDHTGKDDDGRKRGARGWSGKEGAADAVFLINGEPGALTATVKVRKPPKDGRAPEPITFHGHEVVLGQDGDGDLITSLAFDHARHSAPISREAIDLALQVKLFLKVVQDLPAKTRDVAEAMAKAMLPEDASQGAFDAQTRTFVTWLDNAAAGKGSGKDCPEVKACLVDCKPRMWRRADPTPPAEAAA